MYKYELIHFWSTQKLQKFWLQDIPLFRSHLLTLQTNLRYQRMPQRCIEALSEHTYRWSMISVTRLGDFWNFLVTNYVTKVTRLFSDFMGSLKKHCFLSQTGEATFWTTFVKTWATFYFNIWSHFTVCDSHERAVLFLLNFRRKLERKVFLKKFARSIGEPFERTKIVSSLFVLVFEIKVCRSSFKIRYLKVALWPLQRMPKLSPSK